MWKNLKIHDNIIIVITRKEYFFFRGKEYPIRGNVKRHEIQTILEQWILTPVIRSLSISSNLLTARISVNMKAMINLMRCHIN
jgi:hypothetical protein